MAEEQKPCPCNQTLSDAQVNLLDFGMQNYNNILTDPNSNSIGSIRSISDNVLSQLRNQFGVGGGAGGIGQAVGQALPSLNSLANNINNQAQIIDGFAAESARLSTPRGLLSTVSSLNVYAELSCLFGIEGLNIGAGLGVINQDGQFAIQGVLNANVNIQQILDNFRDIDPTSTNPIDQNSIQQLDAQINESLQGLNGSLDKVNEVLASALSMQNEAAAFIERFTNVSAIADLVNQANIDPCFRFAAEMNGSIVDTQFLNAVKSASVPVNTGSGVR